MRWDFWLITALLSLPSAAAADPDELLSAQRSFTSVISASLGDAGIALNQGAEGMIVNPALLYSFRKEMQSTHGTVFASYGRDSLFPQHIAEAGISFGSSDWAYGILGRYLKSNDEGKMYEATLGMSREMFQKSDQQGPVDFGVNISYDQVQWAKRDLDSLPSTVSWYDTNGMHLNKADSIAGYCGVIDGVTQEQRVIVDIGFFQKDISPNLDFGLVFHNLVGYRWAGQTPAPSDSVNAQRKNDTLVLTDVQYYDPSSSKEDDRWLESRYRTLVLGLTYRFELLDGNLKCSLPLDIGGYGIFDSGMKKTYSLETGLQAQVFTHYYVRLGYAREPGTFSEGANQFPDVNVFAAGCGVRIRPVAVNLFVNKTGWGLSAAYDY